MIINTNAQSGIRTHAADGSQRRFFFSNIGGAVVWQCSLLVAFCAWCII